MKNTDKKTWFASVYISFSLIFVIVPLILILWFSITKPAADGHLIFTLDNFRRFFITDFGTKNVYIGIFLHSALLAFLCTISCLILGYPVAYILAKSNFKYKETLLFLMIAPTWINFLLRTYAWLSLLENNGLINRMLQLFGVGPFQLMYNNYAVLLVMICDYLPFIILPIYSALEKMDNSLIEAAADLGSSKSDIFWRVTLPLSTHGIVSGAIMVFMPAITTFVISRYFNGSSLLFGDLIEHQFSTGDWYFGSSLAVILIVVILILTSLSSIEDKEYKKHNKKIKKLVKVN